MSQSTGAMNATVAIIAAALLGAAGVAAAAAGTHGEALHMNALALIALTHAPALMAIALLAPANRAFSAALLFIGVGAGVFCVDMAMRQFTGRGLLAYASPVAGFVMIVGWLSAGLGAILAQRRA